MVVVPVVMPVVMVRVVMMVVVSMAVMTVTVAPTAPVAITSGRFPDVVVIGHGRPASSSASGSVKAPL